MRTLVQIVIVFLWELASSCTPQWTYVQDTGSTRPEISVCIEASDAQRPKLSQAVHAWDQSLHEWKHVVEACPGDVTAFETPEPCPDGPNALACADNLGGSSVRLVQGRYEKDPTWVLAHELGHVFGAQHTSRGLMVSNYEHGPACPDELTIMQVASYQHVNATRLRFCY